MSDGLQKRISKGKRAALLMQDELINGAFETLKATYTKALFESHALDNVSREKLYIAFNIVGKVKDHLAAVMTDGKLAQAELDRLNSAPER